MWHDKARCQASSLDPETLYTGVLPTKVLREILVKKSDATVQIRSRVSVQCVAWCVQKRAKTSLDMIKVVIMIYYSCIYTLLYVANHVNALIHVL